MESLYWLILVIPAMLLSIFGIILSEGFTKYMWTFCLLLWTLHLIKVVV